MYCGGGMGLDVAVAGGGDGCVVLTTDPKPRLRWTAELHDRFIDAVTHLGGPETSCIGESQDTGSSTSASSNLAQDLNDGYQVTEALRVQMEVQRRLHDQLEVQRRLQLRIEAQGKYLQSILEKACNALNDQAAATAGLEAAREELSELAIKVSNDNYGSNLPAQFGDCSVYDSCLTSVSQNSAAIKKRPRPLYGNGETVPHMEWPMT